MEAGHRSSFERFHGRFESLDGGKAAPRKSLLDQSEYRKVAKKRKMKSLTPSGLFDSLKAEKIKLGVDVHLSSYVVAVKVDCSAPLRAKRMSPEEFLILVGQLKE
jgi:hypothetical protein